MKLSCMYTSLCIKVYHDIAYALLFQKIRKFSSSSFLLCILGLLLLAGGINDFATSQTDPIRLQDQDPIPLVGTYPIPLITSPHELRPLLTIQDGVLQTDAAPIAVLDGSVPEEMEADYDDSLPRFAAGNLLMFIEGSFGALVMIGAGLGAIIAGAFGAYKAAISLLFVAVGAFILRALVSLFFGTNYDAYSAGGIEFVGGGL
jgi:hypothetical protein